MGGTVYRIKLTSWEGGKEDIVYIETLVSQPYKFDVPTYYTKLTHNEEDSYTFVDSYLAENIGKTMQYEYGFEYEIETVEWTINDALEQADMENPNYG